MKDTKKKKTKNKKVRAPRQPKGNVNGDVSGKGREEEGGENAQNKILTCLAEAFSSLSLDKVALAYGEAGGDANKAAEILGGLSESGSDAASGCWSSSERCYGGDDPSTSSSSSERISEADDIQLSVRGKSFGGKKSRKLVASAGTVSGVIGKDYMRTKPVYRGEMCNSSASNVLGEESANNAEVERFLWSILGDDSELSMDVVRDVLGHCGYNVEKALDTLLDLSVPCHNRFKDRDCSEYDKDCDKDSRTFIEHVSRADGKGGKPQLPRRVSDSNFHLSEQEFQLILQSSSQGCSTATVVEAGLPQKVLESLFNIPKISEHESCTMNWKNVLKKMESFGQGLNLQPPNVAMLHHNNNYGKDEEYQEIRKVATKHYDAMKSCYQKAATAYSRGEKGYAAYLSDQGRILNKLAKEADERASQEIFHARNKGIHNVVTIDLHGQHVKQAIMLFKAHLLVFSTYIPSVQLLRVITGCGTHGVGTGKLKQSVIGLMEKEGISWSEENRGTLLVKLGGRRNFSFVESEDDSG